jgi:D-sedoheptulose 7-phosphate isomerase
MTKPSQTVSQSAEIDQEFVEAARLASAFAADEQNGGKVLAVGNGGSCADAIHFCEELTGRYRKDRPSIPAIVCADPGHITCTANDYGFDQVFGRWIEGLGNEGDVLIAMSTSGNSENIIKAVEAASNQGLHIALFLGKDGGKLRTKGDTRFVVPGETADRIQELHMLALHALVGAVERALGYC